MNRLSQFLPIGLVSILVFLSWAPPPQANAQGNHIVVDGRNNRITYLAFNASLLGFDEFHGIQSLDGGWDVMWGVDADGEEIAFYTWDELDFYQYWIVEFEDGTRWEGWDYVLADGFEGDLFVYEVPDDGGSEEGAWYWTNGDWFTRLN